MLSSKPHFDIHDSPTSIKITIPMAPINLNQWSQKRVFIAPPLPYIFLPKGFSFEKKNIRTIFMNRWKFLLVFILLLRNITPQVHHGNVGFDQCSWVLWYTMWQKSRLKQDISSGMFNHESQTSVYSLFVLFYNF